jgi:hypothetical protein
MRSHSMSTKSGLILVKNEGEAGLAMLSGVRRGVRGDVTVSLLGIVRSHFL